MIQIVFFMSMITIAALLLNMFWSVSDSHDKEYLIMCQIRRRSVIRKRHLMNLNGSVSSETYNYNTGIGTVRSVSNINLDNNYLYTDNHDKIHSKSYVYNFNKRNITSKGKVIRTNKVVQFYDLGPSEYIDNSIDSHKNDCA
jgi:hypothetical protein